MAATPVAIPIESGQWSGGSLKTVVVPFNEAGAAGSYVATVQIPAGSQLIDIMWTNKAVWGAGTSATLDVGDTSTDASAYMEAVDIKTVPAAGNAINVWSSGSAADATGTKFYDQADVITATVVTVGTTSSVGRSFLTVVYVPNVPSLSSPTQA